ncbi:MAG TPA: 2-oxoglutarate dehydrogenase E1 component [Bacteroidales bacterium]|nr:2-oxoglutarate dehydrogenase E1 component [Bacteroidales bacterium]HPT09505.1 2-oxoglutarate dehydrogenase E1 component [Bacteroidales bacterium]
MDPLSYLNTMNNSAIDEMFERYRNDPESVENSWRKFFEGFEFCQRNYQSDHTDPYLYPNEFKVMNLITAYRQRGHLFTRTNPVRTRRQYTPTLDIVNFGLTTDDLGKTFQAGKELGIGNAKLEKILEHLQQTYCQSIGVEYYYIRKPEITEWLKLKMESTRNTPDFTPSVKKKILEKLAEGVLFEKFIHKKFPGQKRFSLEGAESLIPAMEEIIQTGATSGLKEIVFGMAHRGRINVLGNIMQKPFHQIFSEFEGKEYADQELLGDVKYHLGYSIERSAPGNGSVRITLAPNPSHLEAVDPVVEGICRSRIDHVYNGDFSLVLPVLIHGDASVAGQGIIYELLQMSELEGYKTGGTLHFVINNQLGFTTNYLDGRSSIYCTDVAKTIQAPIFHVNADDVEAVVYTTRLALAFREKFHKDVFIDLLGYRKYGHNESDEPRFTQPLLYKIIEQHPDPMEIYLRKLEEEGLRGTLYPSQIKDEIEKTLEKGFEQSKTIEKGDITPFLDDLWKGYRRANPSDFDSSPETGVESQRLMEIGLKITTLPEGKSFFRKIRKMQDDRRAMLENGRLDWAMGELLAYGTLLYEGHPVRLSGQDCQRGTFSHRHAVLTVEDSEEKYIPLNHLSEGQARFNVYNSLLSEYGVLGFEYGYNFGLPEGLTLWEAQFGDFSNGAQVVIDQYISSAEDKWKVMNGVVLLLPHGYEGQGPEHSSARLERFLSLCGHYNMQVVNTTTPANFFHVLRRQIHRPFRKPLIIFTPKSLLRHPLCASAIDELTHGRFREVIDDPTADPEKIKRVVFCSGKVYYDILEEKERLQVTNTAIIRLEQLYPLPQEQILRILERYPLAVHYEWVQEEPVNMGAWKYILINFNKVQLHHVARPASGSPATGSSRLHKIQQQLIVEKALGRCSCEHAQTSCRLHCAEKENDTI